MIAWYQNESLTTIARQLVCISAVVGALAGPGLSEELNCRWFIPATGTTVPVRCDDANPHIAAPIPQEGQPGKALLGLTVVPLTQDLKDAYGIDKTVNGVLVTQVDLNSEAEERGMTRGDVILQTNQEAVSSPEDLARSLDTAAKDGRKAISLLLSTSRGQIQHVSLSL